MKIIISLLLMVCCVVWCKPREPKNDVIGDLLRGNHLLRKMNTQKVSSSQGSAGFFFIVGGANYSSKEEMFIFFSWLMNDKETYAISKLLLTNIRVRFANKISQPYIKFHWEPSAYAGYNNLIEAVTRINYAVIVCKPSDWKIDIQMPMEKK